VGVPQGSPISPVLSVVYTSPLLHLMRAWFNSSMRMYVDNGLFFACGDTWEEVCHLLRSGYRQCTEWLATVGLAIEPDKSELMFFQKPQERHPVPRPSSLNLWDPESASEYTVRPVETLHYLGFFLHWRLNWEPHVCIMANRAHASLKALTVLGNSIQGLNMANWCLAFNAICLPVLSYGVQLWLCPGVVQQKKLIDLLQKVQNEGVKLVTGAFRTAPGRPYSTSPACYPCTSSSKNSHSLWH
jgi:hypothetical protein